MCPADLTRRLPVQDPDVALVKPLDALLLRLVHFGSQCVQPRASHLHTLLLIIHYGDAGLVESWSTQCVRTQWFNEMRADGFGQSTNYGRAFVALSICSFSRYAETIIVCRALDAG